MCILLLKSKRPEILPPPLTKMKDPRVLFLCVIFATFHFAISHKRETKPKILHSYMLNIYNTRARGNENGSFTILLRRNQKILADSIRGFQPEKSGEYRLNTV